MGHPSSYLNPAVVFAPEVFLAQMSPKRDARSTTTAMLLHAAAIALFFFWGARAIHIQHGGEADGTDGGPDAAADGSAEGHDGRGRGQRGATPVTQGHLPKFANTQITPPKAPPMEQPKIQMPDPTIEVQTN